MRTFKPEWLLVDLTKILNAAYGAFTNGLDLALYFAGALMAASAVVALLTMRRPRQLVET